jgi:hypothetical protein
MGVVYEAEDRLLGIPVALKTLRRVSAQSLYYFKNEFRALAELKHPNLISLYELFNEDGLWFFTMELLYEPQDFLEYVCGQPGGDTKTTADPGRTLAQTLAPDSGLSTGDFFHNGPSAKAIEEQEEAPPLPRFSEVRLRHAARGVAQGLAALHHAGKVHRDVKPSNVTITGDGRVLLLDFGLVAESSTSQARNTLSQVVGTPVYMAPEQASAEAVGPAADWYSLGVMMYEAMSGRAPFSGHFTQILLQKIEQEPLPLRQVSYDIPPDLDALCEELMRISPEVRPSGRIILSRLGARAEEEHAAELFVGRANELHAIQLAFQESQQQIVSMVVVGASGLGKSALVRHFLHQAEEEKRALVLSARCYEQEQVPYKALDGIVDALSRHLLWLGKEARKVLPPEAAFLGKLFPVLQRVPALPKPDAAKEEGMGPQEIRAAACDALREILRRLALERPVILSIDDLQWADGDSFPLLRQLADPENAPAIFVLCTARTTAETGRPISEIAPPGAHVLELGALGGEEANQLTRALAASLGVELHEISQLAREAGGHPLLLDELVRYRAATGENAAPKLEDALFARVMRLPDEARELLEVAAVAGERLLQRVVIEAAGLNPSTGLRLVGELRGARLLRVSRGEDGDIVEPYHDRVREVISTRLPGEAVRQIAKRLARTLEHFGGEERAPESLVRYLELAGETTRAAELAVRAAERARLTVAFDRAVHFYQQALRLAGPHAQQAPALRLALAEAFASSGRGPDAADAFLAAAEGRPEEERLALTHRAAAQLLGSGHIARGLQYLRVVLDELGEPPLGTYAEALASLQGHRRALAARGLFWREQTEKNIPRRVLLKLDVYRDLSLCLAFVDNVRGADYQARALSLALNTGEPRRIGLALLVSGIYWSQEGEEGIQEGKRLRDAAAQISGKLGDPFLSTYVYFASAFIEYYQGRFQDAADRFKAAEELFRALANTSWERSTCRLHRLRATDYRGAWGELAPLYHEYIKDAQRRDDRYAEASLTRWFNVLWLAQDDPARAGADLDRSAWTPPSGGYHLQHFLEVRARVELAFYRGNASQNASWVRPALAEAEASYLFRIQIARAISNWLIGRLALVEAKQAHGEAREQLLREAEEKAALLAAERCNYATVWSEFLLAAAVSQRGSRKDSCAILQGISDYAYEQDLPLCAVIARYRFAEIIGPRGAALFDESVRWMQTQSIRNPARMCEIFAPGF